MSSTDDQSAAVLFADLLLPLHYASRRRGIAYLDRGPDRPTYWGEVVSRTGGLERLPAGCDRAVMLRSLGEYWRRHDRKDFLQLLPQLEKLQQELSGAAGGDDGSDTPLPEFVYPLY
jgi:hypothetical protein